MRYEKHANGDAIGRAPGRKRALPHNNGQAANGAQHIAEQRGLLANDGVEQMNGNDHRVTSLGGSLHFASRQRGVQWRERLIFAFGFLSALALVWSVGISRSHKESTESEIPLELPPDKPSQPTLTTANDDSNSDKALLQPILGKSYKDFISFRKSRFADVRANDPDRCRHPEFYDVDYTHHNLTLGSYAQIWTNEKVKSHFKWKKKRSLADNKKTLAKQKAKYLTPSGWDAKKQRWTAADVIVGDNHTWTFVNSTDKSTKSSKDALQALKSKPKPRSITLLHVGKAGLVHVEAHTICPFSPLRKASMRSIASLSYVASNILTTTSKVSLASLISLPSSLSMYSTMRRSSPSALGGDRPPSLFCHALRTALKATGLDRASSIPAIYEHLVGGLV